MHETETRFDTTYKKIHNGEKAEYIEKNDALKNDLWGTFIRQPHIFWWARIRIHLGQSQRIILLEPSQMEYKPQLISL